MITKETLKKDVIENMEFAKKHISTGAGILPAVFVKGIKNGEEMSNIVTFDTSETSTSRGRSTFMTKLGMMSVVDKIKSSIDSIESVYIISEARLGVIEKKDIKEGMTGKEFEKTNRDVIFSAGMGEDLKPDVLILEVKNRMDFNSGLVEKDFVELSEIKGVDLSVSVVEGNLLESFWSGVKIMEDFLKEKPMAIDQIKELSYENSVIMVDIFMLKINQLLSKLKK